MIKVSGPNFLPCMNRWRLALLLVVTLALFAGCAALDERQRTWIFPQRFEAASKVASIGSPLLVVHGTDDATIQPELGRRLFDAAVAPKALVMVSGGSHYSTNAVGQADYRKALAELFSFNGLAR